MISEQMLHKLHICICKGKKYTAWKFTILSPKVRCCLEAARGVRGRLVWTKKGWIHNQNGSKNYPKEHDQFCSPSFTPDMKFSNFCTPTKYIFYRWSWKQEFTSRIDFYPLHCDNLTFLHRKIFDTDTLIHSAHYFVLTRLY